MRSRTGGPLVARLLEAAPNGPGAPQGASEERLLDVRTVAARLGISSDSVYRRAPQWPFTVRIGRALRFSAQGLDAYLRTRRAWTLDLLLDRVPYSRLLWEGMPSPRRSQPQEVRMHKTTVDLPETLWRAAKIRALDERSDLRAVVIAALEAYLKAKPKSP